MKAGKYIATQRGYLFDRLIEPGMAVTVSAEFLKKHPKFEASWLAEAKSAKVKPAGPSLDELRYEYQEKFKEPPSGTWTAEYLSEALGK